MDTRRIAVNLNTFAGRKRGAALTPDNIADFKNTRFTQTLDIHQVCVTSGSTYEDSGKSADDPIEVLDACQITPFISLNTVCTGFMIATADGYGHKDPHEVAKAATEACSQFTTRAYQTFQQRNNTITSILDFAGQSCQSAELSSLAGAIIKEQKNGKPQMFSCEIGNVGDGMIVVIDGKTRRVKTMLGARQYAVPRLCLGNLHPALFTQAECEQVVNGEKTDIFFTPMPIQDSSQTIQAKRILLEAHDVVIQMTDGMWESLKHETHFVRNKTLDEAVARQVTPLVEYNGKEERCHTVHEAGDVEEEKETPEKYVLYRESKIDEQEFNRILQPLTDKQWNSFEISQALLDVALRNHAISLRKENDEESPHSGDCTTFVVLEVPDMRVENLRPFFERISEKANSIHAYNVLQDSAKYLKDAREIWARNPENKDKNSKAFNQELIEQLEKEICLIKPTEPGYQQGDVRQNQRSFYAPAQIKLLTSDLIDAYIALAEQKNNILCNNNGAKQQKQTTLKEFLHDSCKTTHEKEVFFNFLKIIDGFNTHTHKRWDRFFGLHNTKSWRKTVKEIRNAALEELKKEADAIGDLQDKIKFLKEARGKKIFSDHRNNSIFFGAFGRTQAQIEIDGLIGKTKHKAFLDYHLPLNL